MNDMPKIAFLQNNAQEGCYSFFDNEENMGTPPIIKYLRENCKEFVNTVQQGVKRHLNNPTENGGC